MDFCSYVTHLPIEVHGEEIMNKVAMKIFM